MTVQKPVYMPKELILNFKKKKGMCLPHMFSIFKKISPKTLGMHCVWCKYEPEQYNSPVSV